METAWKTRKKAEECLCACMHVSMDPSPGVITANLQVKVCALECPHNSQKQPTGPTHEAVRGKNKTGMKGLHKGFVQLCLVFSLPPPTRL